MQEISFKGPPIHTRKCCGADSPTIVCLQEKAKTLGGFLLVFFGGNPEMNTLKRKDAIGKDFWHDSVFTPSKDGRSGQHLARPADLSISAARRDGHDGSIRQNVREVDGGEILFQHTRECCFQATLSRFKKKAKGKPPGG